MSWLWLTVFSALALGVYDVAKKYALRKNGVYEVLLIATLLSTFLVVGFAFVASEWFGSAPLRVGSVKEQLMLLLKGIIVTSSWVSGMIAMETVPLTTLSTIKASRPMFVIIFSILLFGEHLSALQWLGVVIVMGSLFMLAFASRKEGIHFTHDKGVWYAFVSMFTGVVSALYDKLILKTLEPFFVQTWSDMYITLILAVIVGWKFVRASRGAEGSLSAKPAIRWDWSLLAIALLITVADALYFFALHSEGALLSVISMIRRGAVIITFILSAVLFKEKNVRDKGLVLGIMLAGVALLLFASS